MVVPEFLKQVELFNYVIDTVMCADSLLFCLFVIHVM